MTIFCPGVHHIYSRFHSENDFFFQNLPKTEFLAAFRFPLFGYPLIQSNSGEYNHFTVVIFGCTWRYLPLSTPPDVWRFHCLLYLEEEDSFGDFWSLKKFWDLEEFRALLSRDWGKLFWKQRRSVLSVEFSLLLL